MAHFHVVFCLFFSLSTWAQFDRGNDIRELPGYQRAAAEINEYVEGDEQLIKAYASANYNGEIYLLALRYDKENDCYSAEKRARFVLPAEYGDYLSGTFYGYINAEKLARCE